MVLFSSEKSYTFPSLFYVTFIRRYSRWGFGPLGCPATPEPDAGGGDQNNPWFYLIIGFFWLFGLLTGGQLSDFTGYIEYFRLFDFSTSCQEVIMIDFNDYIWFIRLFDFLTSWWEVKMIDFIEYIDFLTFRLFDLLVGGLSDHFY